jgi:hypothetical protein
MKRLRTPRAIASGLALLFTVQWWFVLVGSVVLTILVLTTGLEVGVQIGPNGEPDFVAGSGTTTVLPVAFELDPATARVVTLDGGDAGAIEHATGRLRLATPDRQWTAMAGAAVAIGLVLWILAELIGLCRSIRDGQPFAPANAGRVRRLALALAAGEVCRAVIVYSAQAYAAAHFSAEHLRFTASPHVNGVAIVSALILLTLAEVFRTGTQLDEDQSLTV